MPAPIEIRIGVPMALTTGSRLGPYEILSPLGAGGMGEVYRARDTRLEREVAVKVLPEHLAQEPEALARFHQEARAVAALSHPNILAIHDFGQEEGIVYCVVELLAGQTLGERLNEGPPSLARALEWATQIAQGLAAAHDRGIVHRDLKPDNVFVTRDGHVKILDFGLAKSFLPVGESRGSREETAVPQTQTGIVLGTVAYMAPEQLKGEPADPRSDIFAFGVVLYEMLAGRHPFRSETAADTMVAIIKEEPPPLSDAGRPLPAGLEEVVRHCLEKRPEDRFQAARDLSFALRMSTPSGGSRLSGAQVEASTAESSIAVLPFRNMSADPEAEYFSDGITEEITNALTKIEGLRVAAHTSSFAYKGKSTDIRRIGQELGVRCVLEGSVRQAGRRLRITAQLIDVGTGYHLWSDRYDREMEDIFAIQDEIARAITEKLQGRLGSSGDAPLVAAPTDDVGAYDLYLKGRYFWNQRRVKLAIEQFEAAIARDPRYAAAYLGLADTYAVWGFYGGIPTWEAFGRARTAAETAQEIAPDSPGVPLSLGIIEHYYGWNLAREERLLLQAAERNPRSYEPSFWLALAFLGGRYEESLAAGGRAVEAEPHSANAHAVRAWGHVAARRWKEALPALRKAVELDRRAAFPLWTLGYVQHQMGALPDAIATLEWAVEVTEREHLFELALLGGALAAAGRTGDARSILAELEERGRRTYVPPFDVAVLLASLGEREQTLTALERAYDERNALLWFRIHFPHFDPLRSEPRWQAITRRLARTAPVTVPGVR